MRKLIPPPLTVNFGQLWGFMLADSLAGHLDWLRAAPLAAIVAYGAGNGLIVLGLMWALHAVDRLPRPQPPAAGRPGP